MEYLIESIHQKLCEKLEDQTRIITESVTKSVVSSINVKLAELTEENKKLKSEIVVLKDKVKFLEDGKRKNNLVFFGIHENQQEEPNLLTHILKLINNSTGLSLDPKELSSAYRLGKKSENPRPVLVNFTSLWRKYEVLKMETNSHLTWKTCHIKKDKLVIYENTREKSEKRKRNFSESPKQYQPQSTTQKRDEKIHKNITSSITPSRIENKILYIATLNCLSLRTHEKLTELELALLKINWDILGLSEIRRIGESIEDHKEYIFYHKGEIKGSHGVGFMVKKYLQPNIEEFKGISDRIAILYINLPGFKDN
ncbi:unnamed protein product [Pieris macdunnoughi]|uniref:Endonuclease-reverse transcriptase n=1 Tax=Pieris macdunnoughi TaxID=345717 RepID=A0A821WAQ6_9NEOP|nr:unnamed protein product [Pieris macdunnoughi]